MNSQQQIRLSKLQEFKARRFYKYLISLFIIALFSSIQKIIWPYIDPAPFLLFYPAVILACLHGDGNFAIVLSILASQYFFIPPVYTFEMSWPNDYIRMAFFLVASLMIRKVIRQQMTERLKAEAAVERLEESEKNLKLEREAREQFVSTLTHDLQTPLTAVKLNLELMKRKKDDPEAVVKSQAKAYINVARVEGMIQNLLDANRIKAGQKIHVDCEEVNFNTIILQTAKELNSIHGNRFVTDCREDLAGCWSVEAVRRILENLCNNAVKYGDESDITIRTDVLADGVVLSVNNKGSVIPEADQKKLFDSYQRTISAEKSTQKGWGIGLTLVKGLAEAHAGNVSVVSDEKNGTTFKVWLPQDFRKLQVKKT